MNWGPDEQESAGPLRSILNYVIDRQYHTLNVMHVLLYKYIKYLYNIKNNIYNYFVSVIFLKNIKQFESQVTRTVIVL